VGDAMKTLLDAADEYEKAQALIDSYLEELLS
jgi:hypothetical protein